MVASEDPENYSELWLPVLLDICMKTNCWFNRNRLLSHLRTGCCALAAIAVAALTLPSAEASGPQPASGGFNPCFHYAGLPRQAGENLIIRFNVAATTTGTFTGSTIGIELDMVHPDGSITLHGTAIFTGSVGGRSGTLLFTYTGKGSAVTGHENLHFVGRQGTDGLAGVHVEGTIEGDLVPGAGGCDVAGAATYTGQILFAP